MKAKDQRRNRPWIWLCAACATVALTAWAAGSDPHYVCWGSTDLTQCDSNCNGQCKYYSYSGTCNTCSSSPSFGENQCNPSANPTTVPATIYTGQCNDIFDPYGMQEGCNCPGSSLGSGSSGTKTCDGCQT
jgi:hypothetical protein